MTPEEVSNPVLKAEQDAFDIEVEWRLGPAGKISDFTDDSDLVTSKYPLYEDNVDSVVETVPDVDAMQETTSELGDTYIGAEVLLPIGGQQQAGIVRHRKCGHDENLLGKAHNNPILDTRTYENEFADGLWLSIAPTLLQKKCGLNVTWMVISTF